MNDRHIAMISCIEEVVDTLREIDNGLLKESDVKKCIALLEGVKILMKIEYRRIDSEKT